MEDQNQELTSSNKQAPPSAIKDRVLPVNESPEAETQTPAQAASKIDSQTESPMTNATPDIANVESLVAQDSAKAAPQPAPAASPARIQKRILVSVVAAIFVIAICSALAVALRQKDSPAQTQTASKPSETLMGAELSVADGGVQVSSDNISWKDATVATQIKQDMYVRTQPNARAVITLDDGSAIRLNSGSVVRIDNLSTKNIVITNASGEVYTRVVASSRKFTVKAGDEQYLAMGTAYKTINTPETSGVEVYHSSVKVIKQDVAVTEGKYFYIKSADASQQQKLTDISSDKIKQDAFVAWNYEQDKQNSEFKDKLGYLTKIDEPATPQPTKASTTTATQIPQSRITLAGAAYDSGVKLNWSLTNLSAPKGFKVVKSLSANPTYGKDEYAYVSKPSTTSYAWSIKNGKTYHFRVCIYTGDGCSTYSNDVVVTAPLVADTEPTGSLSLSAAEGKTVNWTMTGSAPKGFKLVWSAASNPVYPGSTYNYYSDEATRTGTVDADSGTYHVRVCMYTGGGCTNYSNEIIITIP